MRRRRSGNVSRVPSSANVSTTRQNASYARPAPPPARRIGRTIGTSVRRPSSRRTASSSTAPIAPAADGQQGLEAARRTPPDLALLDVQMPRLDGLSLCRAFKTSSETRFVPVIIVTALDSEEEKLKAIEAGADDFVTKPYNAIVLLTRVRSLLRIKKLHDELESRNRLLRQVLDRYVAEDVADIILTDPERYLKLGGEIRPVTVLFA